MRGQDLLNRLRVTEFEGLFLGFELGLVVEEREERLVFAGHRALDGGAHQVLGAFLIAHVRLAQFGNPLELVDLLQQLGVHPVLQDGELHVVADESGDQQPTGHERKHRGQDANAHGPRRQVLAEWAVHCHLPMHRCRGQGASDRRTAVTPWCVPVSSTP